MEIGKVGVVGCGLMGHGIAQICAQAGWEVVVREVDQERLDAGIGKIEKQLCARGREGKDRAGRCRCRARPHPGDARLRGPGRLRSGDRGDHRGPRGQARDVAGGRRDRQGRRGLRHQHLLAGGFRPGGGDQPARALPRAALLQPRPGDAAAGGGAGRARPTITPTTTASSWAAKLGKTTVAAGDNRGFIVNRLLVPYMLDAIRALEQGVGSIEDIDTGMMAGASHPMGPLTLADFVGLDTLASIADVMVEAYGEERFAPPETLKKLVDAGHYGRKSGRGFYDYSGEQAESGGSGHVAAQGAKEREWTRTASRGFAAPPSTWPAAAMTAARWTRSCSSSRTGSREAGRSRPIRSWCSASWSGSASRTAKVLTVAGEAADALKADAEAEAREALDEARIAANAARVEADRYSEQTRAEADEYSQAERGKADAYANETRAEVDAYDQQTRIGADAYAGQTREAAEALARDLRADAEHDAKDMRGAAKAEAERTMREARKQRQSLETVIADSRAAPRAAPRRARAARRLAGRHRQQAPRRRPISRRRPPQRGTRDPRREPRRDRHPSRARGGAGGRTRSATTRRSPSRASSRCASGSSGWSTRSRSPRRRCSPTGRRRGWAPTGSSPAWHWSAGGGSR